MQSKCQPTQASNYNPYAFDVLPRSLGTIILCYQRATNCRYDPLLYIPPEPFFLSSF